MSARLRLAALAVACAAGCRAVAGNEPLPAGDYTPREPDSQLAAAPDRLAAVREDALRRARVWRSPPVPVAQADLRSNPPGPGAFAAEATVVCKFHRKTSRGYSPKFHCVIPDEGVVKVKYGHAGREVRTEVASTRLLAALGFGADRMYIVQRVRCFGCPQYPHANEKLSWFNDLLMDFDRFRDFDFVAIERPLEGDRIEVPGKEGWGWEELSLIDPARGGSSREEVDALRLMAVFLGNWDTKYENQRLVCLKEGPPVASAPSCAMPFAYMQDVGASFGPRTLDLSGWRARPVWADPATCLVSMKTMPYDGVTFPDTRITERGRRFLAERLTALSHRQVTDLFEGARFTHPHVPADARHVAAWVDAFLHRVRQIADRPPCPDP